MNAPQPLRPLVIAHRGASGYLPEHTLEAYALAIAQGADFIEPDLVATADGVLIARHENELSGTTDVAAHARFASRRTAKRIDGRWIEGWFSEDFTLDEIRQLRARERLPALRTASAAHDGRYRIPTLAEILVLARAAERDGRVVGIYPETKRPTWFAAEGTRLDGGGIGISLGDILLRTLLDEGFTDPSRVFIQSFEVANLIELAEVLLPRHGLSLPLVQLLGDTGSPSVPLTEHLDGPWDLAWHRQCGHALETIYGELPEPLRTAPTTYAQLATPQALAWMRRRYASAIGPWKQSLWPRLPLADQLPAALLPAAGATGPAAGGGARPAADAASSRRAAAPTSLCADALAAGLAVHAYTLRADPPFLALGPDGQLESVEDELRALVALGISGVFIDQPDRAVAALSRPDVAAL